MTNEETVEKINKVIERVRPYINRDGGDIRFVKYHEGIVYVEMMGACVGCAALNNTLKDGVEAIMLEEVPGVIGVELA